MRFLWSGDRKYSLYSIKITTPIECPHMNTCVCVCVCVFNVPFQSFIHGCIYSCMHAFNYSFIHSCFHVAACTSMPVAYIDRQ